MTELDHTTAALKAFLEALPSIAEVKINFATIYIYPSHPITLPLSLRLECELLESHQETIDGKTATVIDDFRIVSAKLITAEDTDEPRDKEDSCPIQTGTTKYTQET